MDCTLIRASCRRAPREEEGCWLGRQTAFPTQLQWLSWCSFPNAGHLNMPHDPGGDTCWEEFQLSGCLSQCSQNLKCQPCLPSLAVMLWPYSLHIYQVIEYLIDTLTRYLKEKCIKIMNRIHFLTDTHRQATPCQALCWALLQRQGTQCSCSQHSNGDG